MAHTSVTPRCLQPTHQVLNEVKGWKNYTVSLALGLRSPLYGEQIAEGPLVQIQGACEAIVSFIFLSRKAEWKSDI